MRLDLKENIVYPFSDPSWIVKTLLGVVFQVLCFTFPALVGYQLAIIRQTANGEDERLPEFSGFGRLWWQGLIVCFLMFGLALIPLAASLGISFFLLPAAGSDNAMLALAVTLLSMLGMLVILLVMAAFWPALMLRYAMTGQVSSLTDFSTALGDMRQGPADYAVIVLFPVVASIAIGALTTLTAGIGGLFSLPLGVLMMFIQARMLGNYYRLYFM